MISKRISKTFRNESGMTSLEAVIGTMVFVMLFCALMDLMLLSNRFSTLTDTGKELARTLSVQGGALEVKPDGYASNYYTISRLTQLTERNMKSAGFNTGEWEVLLEYDQFYDETDPSNPHSEHLDTLQNLRIMYSNGTDVEYVPTPKIDYLSDFRLKIHATYNWKFLGLVMPVQNTNIVVTMPGMSEWKYNYDYWPSETG